MGPVNTLDLDCKTVRIFAYSGTREQSNKRSGTRLKTESETGDRRFFFLSPHTPERVCVTGALRARKTLTPRFSDFFTNSEKKTDCSAVYIGLVFDVIVGFSYKPSLNSFFVYDFVLAIDCNQLLLIERFSYDLETKTRQQNRNNKRAEIGQFDWFIERIQTRLAFGWLSERSGEKTSRPRTF